MSLIDCKKNTKYIVTKLDTIGSLRQRLVSFGFMRGAIVQYISSTNLNKTYKIKVDKMHIALRKEEAEKIQVKIIL